VVAEWSRAAVLKPVSVIEWLMLDADRGLQAVAR
jgi:hypothetical protein